MSVKQSVGGYIVVGAFSLGGVIHELYTLQGGAKSMGDSVSKVDINIVNTLMMRFV